MTDYIHIAGPGITRAPPSTTHQQTTPLKITPLRDNFILKKEPSPATLASLLHGEMSSPCPHTHSSLLTHSPDLFTVQESPSIDCDMIGRTPSKGRPSLVQTTFSMDRSITARMLTYNNSQENITPSLGLTTPPSCETTPPTEERTILDIPGLYSVSENEVPSLEGPPGTEESASMMAFALCTPTKDDRRDFHHAFDQTY